ncbi:hypothetical protein [Lacinutrix sp. Bg11-31]|uniref:hypothetical protein n=1 Tax=Lacinutrix sp. Bg11-31 TaxID=2057808 RepID=UPI000C30EAC2|nr:hypothetical protein [Lacinutrix sp. Bg11-31]AUC81923.1 hypothetical protein CW733_07185 [Lacinutrix sp. Bg11-31]
MSRSLFLILVAIAVFTVVIALDYFDLEALSSVLELSVVPLITIMYLFISKNKCALLSVFFITYTIGDIVNILDFNAVSNWSYYVCNTAYIVAYFFLILYITKSFSFKRVFKNYLFEFIVLLMLDFYMIYVLVNIINPINFESNYIELVQAIEFLYSLMIIIVLSFSFLNYIQNIRNKYLLLFVSCVLIAFSELVLIGYYYIVDDIKISYASTILFVCGILMLFFHTFMEAKRGYST